MKPKEQRKEETANVRIRTSKHERVKVVAAKEAGARGVLVDPIDIYDEILEKELPKYERKHGII
jgi:hypothetical protein